jgi:hypothetical protein
MDQNCMNHHIHSLVKCNVQVQMQSNQKYDQQHDTNWPNECILHLYSLYGYLMLLLTALTIRCWRIVQLAHNDLKRATEGSVHSIFQSTIPAPADEELRQSMKTLSHVSQCAVRNSNCELGTSQMQVTSATTWFAFKMTTCSLITLCKTMWTPCVISKNFLPFFQDPKALWNHHPKTRFLMTDCGKGVGLNVHWFYCEVNRWEISPSLVIVPSDAAWGQGHLAPQTEIHILIHPYP